MFFRQFIAGPIETNCYLGACEATKEAFIVDPDIRTDTERGLIIDEMAREGFRLKYVINTHSHPDHTGGNAFLKDRTGAALLIHEEDASWLTTPWAIYEEQAKKTGKSVCPACSGEACGLMVREDGRSASFVCSNCGFSFEFLSSPPADRLLHDGDTVQVGMMRIAIIHTPGHSRGGICLYLEKESILFSGDTLFSRSIGRTDQPGSSFEHIIVSLKRLMTLPDETAVYPGHGDGTTIGEERRENPYLA